MAETKDTSGTPTNIEEQDALFTKADPIEDLSEISNLLANSASILRLAMHKMFHPRLESYISTSMCGQHLIDCLASLEDCSNHVNYVIEDRVSPF